MRHFLGRPEAPQRDLAADALRDVIGDGVCHGGGDEPRQDGVDAHAAARRLPGQTARQSQDAALAGGVIDLTEIALLGDDGTHVDDAAAATVLFDRGRVFQKTLASEKGPREIDVDHLVPVGCAEIANEIVARNAGAVHQNRGLLGALHRHDRFHLRAVRHVAPDQDAAAAAAALVVVVVVVVSMFCWRQSSIQPEDRPAARPFELADHGLADAGRGARDNGATIRELQPRHLLASSK